MDWKPCDTRETLKACGRIQKCFQNSQFDKCGKALAMSEACNQVKDGLTFFPGYPPRQRKSRGPFLKSLRRDKLHYPLAKTRTQNLPRPLNAAERKITHRAPRCEDPNGGQLLG